MKTLIYVAYNYGGWSLCFKKDVELPFTPFYDMRLCFDGETSFPITNNKYTTSIINYDVVKNEFLIEIRNNWLDGVRGDVVDNVFDIHSNWERVDTTDVDKLKELMNRNYDAKF